MYIVLYCIVLVPQVNFIWCIGWFLLYWHDSNSIVVKKGQTLTFSAVGFEDKDIEIPEDVTGMYLSLTVELVMAEVSIDEITVFPWPDRDNLAAEFLAMQPTRAGQLEAIAKENLARNELLAIAANTDMDSRESSSYYLRQQASDYSYKGQQAPQRIFDPLAWGKFFKQWKKKKHSDKEEKMIKILEGENSKWFLVESCKLKVESWKFVTQ